MQNLCFPLFAGSVTLGLTLFLSPVLKAEEKGEKPDQTFVERATDFTLRHHVGSSLRLNATNPLIQENIKPSAAPFPPDNPPFFVIPPELKTTVVDGMFGARLLDIATRTVELGTSWSLCEGLGATAQLYGDVAIGDIQSCSQTIVLPTGRLVLGGVINNTDFEWRGQPQTLAIVGGTGAYASARGTVILENPAPQPPGFGDVIVKVYITKK